MLRDNHLFLTETFISSASHNYIHCFIEEIADLAVANRLALPALLKIVQWLNAFLAAANS